MRKQILISLFAGCITILASSVILANTAPTQTIKMSTVLQNLQADGYVAVEKVTLEHGFYKAEAINKQGERVDVRLNPETGKIIAPKSTHAAIAMLDAIKKVEEAGYHNIYKIKSEGNEYEIDALDKDGKSSDLKVNVFSGNVTKRLFD